MTTAARLKQNLLGWSAIVLLLVHGGLGLTFSLLCLNYNRAQSDWIWLNYLWETPLVAGLLVFHVNWWGLNPLIRSLTLGEMEAEPLRQSLRRARRLPLLMGLTFTVAFPATYLFASVQLHQAAGLPELEAAKNALIGIPVGLLSGLLIYFLASLELAPIVKQLQSLCPDGHYVPSARLFAKTVWSLLVVAVVSLTGVSLMAFTLSQRLLEQTLMDTASNRLANLAAEIQNGQPWRESLQFQGSEILAIVGPAGNILHYRGPEEQRADFRAELPPLAAEQGRRILRHESTLVQVWRRMGDVYLVAELPLSQYPEQLLGTTRSLLAAALLTLVVVGALATLLAYHLSRPVIQLTRLARTVSRGWPRDLEIPYSDDEIGTLGQSLAMMLEELRRAERHRRESNQQVCRLLEQRNQRLHQLGAMLDLSRSVGSELHLEGVLRELLSHIRELTGVEACSILLRERHGLTVAAVAGFSPASHPAPSESWVACDTTRALSAHLHPEIFPPELLPLGLDSLLSLPLQCAGQSIGVINVFSRAGAEGAELPLHLLRPVALQAAVAIENARLYEERQLVTDLLRRALEPEGQWNLKGLRVGHRYTASRLLSGDYYDIVGADPTRVTIIMADVAGKGPEAAIQTIRAKHTLRTAALAGLSPARMLDQLNQVICQDLDGRMVTVFCAQVDLSRKLLTWCSAGHEPALLWRVGDFPPRPLEAREIVLGATENLQPRDQTMMLIAGTRLLLYTDGLTEARCPQGGFLGLEPVIQDILEHDHEEDPQALVEAIHRRVEQFTQWTFSDDLSILLLEFA